MSDSGSNRVEGSSPIVTGVLLIAVLAPVIAAFGILWMQAYAAPFEDDYHALLGFAGEFEQQHSVKDKVLLVAAAQHTEYKLVFEHAVVGVELGLTHRLNFSFLETVGDLFLLPIGWLLWLTYGGSGRGLRSGSFRERLVRFLPVSLIFFGLAYWETLNWAMAGLQNLPVIFFSFLAIYLLVGGEGFVESQVSKARPGALTRLVGYGRDGGAGRLVSACAAGALAAFSSANGFLVAVVGAWILLRRRSYWACVAWGVSFVIPLAAYLYHYVPVPRLTGGLYYVARPLEFFAFLGMAAGSFWGARPSNWVGAILLGFAVAGVVAWALKSGYVRVNPVGVYWTVWVLLSALPVAWVRGSTGVVIASRYSIYSCLMLVFCYAFLADRAGAKQVGWWRFFYPAAVVTAVAFCLLKDGEAWTKLGERKETIRAGMAHYEENRGVNSPLIDRFVIENVPGEEGYEGRELRQAIESGIYKPRD
jgi:hypothetical protein